MAATTPPLGQPGAPYSIAGPVNQADRANLERIASLMIVAEAGRPVYQCDLFDDLGVRHRSGSAVSQQAPRLASPGASGHARP